MPIIWNVNLILKLPWYFFVIEWLSSLRAKTKGVLPRRANVTYIAEYQAFFPSLPPSPSGRPDTQAFFFVASVQFLGVRPTSERHKVKRGDFAQARNEQNLMPLDDAWNWPRETLSLTLVFAFKGACEDESMGRLGRKKFKVLLRFFPFENFLLEPLLGRVPTCMNPHASPQQLCRK